MAKKRTWKDAVLREQARQQARELRAMLAGLRVSIREARGAYRTAKERAREVCRTERARVRAEVRVIRQQLLAELRQRTAAAKQDARERCAREFAAAREIRDVIERDRAQLKSEIAFRASLRRIEASNRAGAREARGRAARAHERLRESDDTVAGNIPPELRPLWEKVKGRVRDKARETRTEAFLRYAEEHPHEILRANEDESDARLRELLAERDRRDRELRDVVPF